jgi:hypothetical protein
VDGALKAREDGLVIEALGGELLIYDLERDRAHALNETAALVFRHCDGRHGVAELAALLSKETGRPVDEAVVRRALQRLQDTHLLEGEWSRRETLRKIGLAGTAVGLGLPVVRSIVIPTPAQAQASCVGLGAMCGTVVDVNTGCTSTTPCCPPNMCHGLAQTGATCTCDPP